MCPPLLKLLILLSATFIFPCTASLVCDADEERDVDVLVLGGGSSGIYGALQLHWSGIDVAVVEQKSTLGGHTQTYRDPQSDLAIDFGVAQYLPSTTVKHFLDSLDIEYVVKLDPYNATWVDFRRGQIHARYSSEDTVMRRVDGKTSHEYPLYAYYHQLLKYPALEHGYADPIPEDLLLPFAEFAHKFDLESAIPLLQYGIANILDLPALYVLKTIPRPALEALQSGLLYTKSQENTQIFYRAHEILQSRVYLSTTATAIHRDATGVHACLSQSGSRTIKIHAKRLLASIPPTMKNFAGWDLSADETGLFSKFSNISLAVGLIRSECMMEPGSVLINTNPYRPFELPSLPGLYRIVPSQAPGLFLVEYGSVVGHTEERVRADIINSVLTVQTCDRQPEIATLASHSPFLLHVNSDDIRAGFYKQLYDLQGQRNTFYTGSAFHCHDTGLLWEFTDKVVDQIRRELLPGGEDLGEHYDEL